MEKREMVIVDVNGGWSGVESYFTDGDVDGAMAHIRDRHERDLAMYRSHLVNYPNMAKQWQRGIERIERAELRAMTFDEFLAGQRRHFLSMPVKEVTAKEYDDMLNVLPPMHWCRIDCVEMFCMSEMWTGVWTSQYARVGDKYYTALVDVFDKETWLHKRINAA